MRKVFLRQRIEHDEACNHFDEICRAAWTQGFVTEWIEEGGRVLYFKTSPRLLG